MTTEAVISKPMAANYQFALQPWLVCFIAAGFFFYEYMQLTVFNAINPALMQTFHISATQAGALSAHYFYANVIFLLPAGLILDRLPTKQLIVVAMLICTVATFAFARASTLWLADVARLVVGVGGAFALLSCVRLTSRWFPPKRLALVIGLIVTMAMTGAIVAQTPMAYLTEHYGWRQAMVIDAMLGLVITVLIIAFVKNYPPGKQAYYQQQPTLPFIMALKQVAANSQNWLAGIYTSCINLPLFLFGAVWGMLYLMQVHGFTNAQSSFVTSALFVGMIIGSPLVGWLSDFIGQRKWPMIIGALLALGTFLIIYWSQSLNLYQAMTLFFLLGLFVSSQILSYPLIAESNSHALTGSAEGLASVLIMAGGFTQGLFGFLMDYHWQSVYQHGIRWYSAANYKFAMSIMLIGFLFAIVAALLIKETNAGKHANHEC